MVTVFFMSCCLLFMTDQLDTPSGHRTRPPRTWRSLHRYRGHRARERQIGDRARGFPMSSAEFHYAFIFISILGTGSNGGVVGRGFQ